MNTKFTNVMTAMVVAASVSGCNFAKDNNVIKIDQLKPSLENVSYKKDENQLPPSLNYVNQGDFNMGNESLKSWTLMKDNIAECTYNADNNYFEAVIEDCGNNEEAIQLYQDKINVVKGEKYSLSFQAKANKVRSIMVSVSDKKDEEVYMEPTHFFITNDWQEYNTEFVITKDSDSDAVLRFYLGREMGQVAIDNVILKPASFYISSDDEKKIAAI